MVVKTTIGFTPFHLVHGIEDTLPIECEIPTLCTVIELLPDTGPISKRLYRMHANDLEEIKKQIKELMDKGYI